jgi:hypothetical protein
MTQPVVVTAAVNDEQRKYLLIYVAMQKGWSFLEAARPN